MQRSVAPPSDPSIRWPFAGRALAWLPDPNVLAAMGPRLVPPPKPPEDDRPRGRGRKAEIVGLVLRGPRLAQRLTVNDLDTIVTAAGLRLVPLRAVLGAMKTEVTEAAGRLRFQVAGGPEVVLDVPASQVSIDGKARPIRRLQATSPVTFKTDVYVPAEDLGDMLNMEFVFNNEFYEYRVDVDRRLPIWKLPPSMDLLSVRAMYVPYDLPTLYPPAEPDTSVVQFFRLRWFPQYDWRPGEDTEHAATVPLPQETLWGRLGPGRYRLELGHFGLAWDDTPKGIRWGASDPVALQVRWFDWSVRFNSSELVLGDTTFGLTDLVFPVSQIAGVRFNGLVGFDPDELASDRSSLGFRQFFTTSQRIEGLAAIGSTVELLLNDRVIDTQEVFADERTPPGTGRYRFEDVRLPGGVVNDIEVRITEPSGIQTRLQREVVDTPRLIGAGKWAYMGLYGWRRDLDHVDGDVFSVGQVRGHFAGGRVAWGVTDALTATVAAGVQHDLYPLDSLHRTVADVRRHPLDSFHSGVSLAWLPVPPLSIQADLAGSAGHDGQYNGLAQRIAADWLISDRWSLQGLGVRYSDDYFDGTDLDLSDRQAVAGRVIWRPGRKWRLEGTVGAAQADLEAVHDEDLWASYQTLRITNTTLAGTNVTAELTRLYSDWDGEATALADVRLNSSLGRGWSFYGRLVRGDELKLQGHSDIFDGLRLLDPPELMGTQTQLSLRKSLGGGHRLSATFNENDTVRQLSFAYDARVDAGLPLVLGAECVRNLDPDKDESRWGFRGRIERFLDPAGDRRVGIQTEMFNDDIHTQAYLKLQPLYAVNRRGVHRVNTRRVRPESGAVQGIVFVDFNANGLLDEGEQGVPEVTVKLGTVAAAETDKTGYYILPGLSDFKRGRVYVDLDTVPAVYSPIHGMQTADLAPGSLTTVNLALGPLIAVSGTVKLQRDGNTLPIAGVVVQLLRAGSEQFVADSITAGDGSFYIGAVRPGRYDVRVLKSSLPEGFAPRTAARPLEVKGSRDVQFLEVEPFLLVPTASDAPADRPPGKETPCSRPQARAVGTGPQARLQQTRREPWLTNPPHRLCSQWLC